MFSTIIDGILGNEMREYDKARIMYVKGYIVT